ncbi:MAG: DUF4168 domain-containing protein [Desulfurivibrionaceae bacterium]|nr:DUF4168 domain-containing protein [Desulfurivibrionaceae bacterium]
MKKMTSTNRKARFLSAVALSLALAATPAMAQSGSNQGAATQQQMQQQLNFDDATLQNFVAATGALGDIQVDFAQRLEGVQDQKKAMDIQKEMNEKMVKAVQDAGLEVQTYNAIANKMSVDEELKNKVIDMQKKQTN